MKTKSPYFKSALQSAHATQFRYNLLGAAPTQNVRNPIPFREIIPMCLPKLPTSYIVFAGTITAKAYGKTVKVYAKTSVDAETFLGENHLSRHALSFDEVLAKIQQRGYLVNNVSSLRCMLKQLPNIRSHKVKGEPVKYYVEDNDCHPL